MYDWFIWLHSKSQHNALKQLYCKYINKNKVGKNPQASKVIIYNLNILF